MAAGRVLGGRYQLIEQLGQGGMGSVWRALRLTNQAEVAIKLIDPNLMVSKDAIGRFRREAQATEVIRSTHVVQILDYDVDSGTPFIVMELLKGETLSKRLEREHALSPGQTAIILGQVAKAMALAHEHRIVHRDLKPENIFIVREHEDEVIKVLDFGIAKHQTSLGDSGGLRTETGMILGTPYYMSPEQVSGHEANHLADIWSFAVIAFECITGRRAFSGSSFLDLGTAICKEPMPVPSAHGHVPEGFDDWFTRTAARAQSERFQSIKAAAEELRAVCGRISARPTATLGPARDGATVVSLGQVVNAQGESNGGTVAVAMHTTPAPASRSIPGLSRPRRHSKWLVGLPVAALALGATALGVRALGHAGEATASSSAAELPSIGQTSDTSSASIAAPAAELPSSERVTESSAAAEVPKRNNEVSDSSQSGQPAVPSHPDAGAADMPLAVPAKPHRNVQVNTRPSKPAANTVVPPAAPVFAPAATKKKYKPEF